MLDPKVMATITAIAYGLTPVILKMAFRAGGTTGLGVIIGLVVAVPLYLLVALVSGLPFDRLTPMAVLAFALGGLAGNAVGRRWNYDSIDLLGPSRSATIRSSSPVWTAFIAVVVYDEQITPVRWLAILAIVAGAALVSWTPGSGAKGWLSIGVLYALGASVAYGIRPIFIKAGLEQADLPVAAALIGSIAALAYVLALERRSQVRLPRVDRSVWLFLLAATINSAAQLLLAIGLSMGDVSLVYTLTSSAPLFTLVFSAILLRGMNEITPQVVLGSLAVVAGVVYI